MKPYADLDLVTFERQYKFNSFLRKLEKTLKDMEFPDVEGIQIASFADQNLTDDGNGNLTIAVSILENQVALGATNLVYLRNHSGVLQYSNDGSTWNNVGSGSGTGGRPLQTVSDNLTLTDSDLHSQKILRVAGDYTITLPPVSGLTSVTLAEITIISAGSAHPIIQPDAADNFFDIVNSSGLDDGMRIHNESDFGVTQVLHRSADGWLFYGIGIINAYNPG